MNNPKVPVQSDVEPLWRVSVSHVHGGLMRSSTFVVPARDVSSAHTYVLKLAAEKGLLYPRVSKAGPYAA